MNANYKVLAINDTTDQLELLKLILERAGYYVITAQSGNKGYEIARREMPDLIISDVRMPDGDGIELCNLIRTDEKLYSVPILLVSALQKDAESIISGIKAGADDYQGIPYEPMQIIVKAARLIERKRMEDALRQSEKRFRSMIENLTDIISIMAADGRIIYESPSLTNVLGYTAEELVGKNAFDFIDPDDMPRVKEFFQKALHTSGPVSPIEYRFRHKDSSWRILQSIGKRQNDPVEGLIAVINSRDITQQQMACEAQQESDARYRQLFDSNPHPIFVYDINSLQILAVNKASVECYGYTAEEFLGMTLKQLHPPKDLPLLLDTVSEAASEDKRVITMQHQKKDGTVIDVEISSNPLVFDGKQVRIFMATDITERRRAKEQLDHFFKVSVDMLCIAGFDGYFKRINPAFEKLLGYSENELLSRPFVEFVHPEDRGRTVEESEINVEGRKTVSFENRYICKDGSIKWLQWNSATIQGEERIYAVAHDITERKLSEKALARANERAIREYDRMLQKLGAFAQVAGTARNLNAVFNAIIDFARPSIPCSSLFISLYNEKESTRQLIYLWYNGKEMDVSEYQSVSVGEGCVGKSINSGEVVVVDDYLEVLRKRGVSLSLGFEEDPRKPRSVLVAPMKTKGSITGVIEVQSYDLAAYTQEHITAMSMVANMAANAIENVRLLEQEQQRAEQMRQSQKLESVGRLAGGIAHDFNNMLTAINGYSGMILRQLDKDDPLRSKIEEIRKAGDRSAALTHQLLAFSRRQVLKPKVLDLNEVVIDTSKLLKRLIGEDVQLNIVPNSNTGNIEVDPGQLSQVVINLAVNARDAMPNGGSLTIETANVYLDEGYAQLHIPTKPGPYVMLAVTDTGTGMSDDILQHIFEPFYTTKDVGKGTGLGLATVYGIVKQSGGYIWVYSEVDQGTTFKIYLPRVDENAWQSESENAIENIPGGNETVLLVEDEDAVRNLTRQILETCGYKVVEARNGVEALSIYHEQQLKVDLLLTDVVMPKMGGRELAEKLIRIEPQIKQLYMSGYTDDTILRQGMIDEGMNFIQKPFTFESLVQKVRDLLDTKTLNSSQLIHDSSTQSNFIN